MKKIDMENTTIPARFSFRLIGLILFLAVIGLSGCKQYQYVMVNSNVDRGEVKEFIIENDSITVKYSFSGFNCPVHITIKNNLSKPIFVDWSKSAVIINGKRYPYWADEATLSAYVQSSQVQWYPDYSSSTGSVSGSIYKNERVSFIPPQSFMTYTPIRLRSYYFNLPGKEMGKEVNIYALTGVSKGLRFDFDKENSPLKFRSFLTLSTEEDVKNPFYLDTEFWTTEVVETGLNPAYIPVKRADQFYIYR
jgi:hypothetical protein